MRQRRMNGNPTLKNPGACRLRDPCFRPSRDFFNSTHLNWSETSQYHFTGEKCRIMMSTDSGGCLPFRRHIYSCETPHERVRSGKMRPRHWLIIGSSLAHHWLFSLISPLVKATGEPLSSFCFYDGLRVSREKNAKLCCPRIRMVVSHSGTVFSLAKYARGACPHNQSIWCFGVSSTSAFVIFLKIPEPADSGIP
jgi:hypothetical protein